MGQLEKYGLYVLCLVIFLILGVAIWGGESEAAPLPNTNLPLNGAGEDAPPPRQLPATVNSASGADAVSALLQPSPLPRNPGRNLLPEGREEQGQPEVDPQPVDPKPVPSPPATRTYVVKDGDILGEIAQRQLGSATRWEEIVTVNPGINPKLLKVGQELILPVGGSSPKARSSDGGWRWHTVRKGESFAIISKRLFGDEKETANIQALNASLDPRKLRPGMEIKVPMSR